MVAPRPARPDGLLRGLVGPALVVAGASMWGLETFWRIPLGQRFDADILVFHEHWMGLLITSPFLLLGARALRTVSRKAALSMVASGVLGSALGTVCFTQALALLNASLANLLLNVQPIISVLVSWVWLAREAARAASTLGRRWRSSAAWRLAWTPGGIESPHRLGLGLLFHRGDGGLLGRVDDVRPRGHDGDRLQDRHRPALPHRHRGDVRARGPPRQSSASGCGGTS